MKKRTNRSNIWLQGIKEQQTSILKEKRFTGLLENVIMEQKDLKKTEETQTKRMDIQDKTDTKERDTDNPHDKGYKRIFSIKKNFLDFIKKYVAFEWMTGLTEDNLELIDKEYITDQFDTYESDLVYKVNTGEESIYLFFLFELQSYNDFTMAFRLLVYMTAIWLDYFKNSDKDARKRKNYRLPPIMPIVLHNGERNWTASRSFKEMISNAEMFDGYIVNFKYILVSVNTLKESKIRNSNTLVDNIFLADKKKTRQEWMDGIMELMHRIREMDKNDLNEWVTWFSNVIRKLDKEERSKFIKQLREGDEEVMCSSFERLLNKEKAEGREQGRAEGREQGRAEGIEQGRAEGREQGRAEGREQGRAEGKAQGKAEGRVQGKAEAIIELLEDIGEPSETLRKCIMEQTELEVLKKWHKIAARAESIEEFEQSVGFVHA